MLSRAATAIPAAATHGSDSSDAVATLTATVHTAGQVATVLLIVTIVVGFYLFTCLVWPFGKCRRCKGVGKFKSPFGSAFRHCGKCDGSGLRVRLGRHVINHMRAVRGAGENSTSKGDK
ncbi:hypothetical protein OHA18_33970 [Kribbella sp. NBC_00709]|uniref:hypothetical protein n=1 Tax=Kribbella sp. NBC_00709 TaxID=2975972 RepID=UPI002E2B38B3|nr:hypothetical protein [Kribbella sp. NBC_00709]